MPFKLTNDYVEELKSAIENKNDSAIHDLVGELHPADIAEIFGEVSPEEASYIYFLLENEKAADVLIEMEDDDREKLLNNITSEELAKHISDNMDSDDAVDVLLDLPEEKQEEVLQKIEDIEQAGEIVDLLNYDEDTAGGLMATELIKVNENWDIDKTIKEIRKLAEEVDEFYYVYVVDDDNILKGTVTLKQLIIGRPNTKIKNIINSEVIYVKADTKSEEVAGKMEKYDLVSIPVVDQLGRLLGRITIDDVVDVIKEEAEKDYQLISGLTEDVEPSDKIFLLSRARLPWLVIGMFGGILGANVMGLFRDSIKLHPNIVLFLPLIAAMGGNVGVQSSSIVVQRIATQTIDLQSTSKKIFKEIAVALLNGSILGSLIFIYNLFFSDSFALTITVSIALMVVVMFASTFGTLIPLVLHKLKIDPALATGPFITTINDVTGIILYLGIGRLFYALF